MTNEMKIEFDAVSENEGFARVSVAAFLTGCNPTLEEISDVKTAVSEAVTNAIIHGYPNDSETEEKQKVWITCTIKDCVFEVIIKDSGIGIDDIEKAMEPLYTTRPEWERSGMGFAFMEAFMDEVIVHSTPGQGTEIQMTKKIGKEEEDSRLQ